VIVVMLFRDQLETLDTSPRSMRGGLDADKP
jgi:hypothetical protein